MNDYKIISIDGSEYYLFKLGDRGYYLEPIEGFSTRWFENNPYVDDHVLYEVNTSSLDIVQNQKESK